MKKILLPSAIFICMFYGAAPAHAQTNAPYSFATFATGFDSPSGVAVDNAGNVYVGDTFNNTIRKITPAGVVSILAGSPGAPGDAVDGTGSAARFDAPIGVAVDRASNVYVADSGNNSIRKITPAGVVTTLAGLAGSPSPVGSTDATGSAARFNGPRGVAVDSNFNVYVADTFNDTIRKITSAGVVTTLAGTAGSFGSTDGTGSAARFNNPRGVAVDVAFNVYVADTSNSTIRKITGGTVTTLAGLAGVANFTDGTGSAARFSGPTSVAVNTAGTLFVADTGNETIRRISNTGVVTTLAGLAGSSGSADGIGSAARFFSPQGVAVYGYLLYVGDTGNNTVRRGLSTSFQTVVKTADFNGDGFADYLLYNPTTQRTAIWYLKKSTFLAGVYGPTLPAGWVVACVADLNHDNKPDYVLFNSSTRRTAVWFLNNNVFSGSVYGPTLPPGWDVIDAADINRDGQVDYVLFNSSTRQTAVWYLNNNAAFIGSVYGPTLPSGWTLSDAQDFNSDGKPDFVLRNVGTRKTAIWYLNGSIYVSGAFGPDLPSSWTLQGAADFDANGRPDYVLFNPVTRQTALWYLNRTALVGSAYGPTLPAGYDAASP